MLFFTIKKKTKREIQILGRTARSVEAVGRTSEACSILKTSLHIAEEYYSKPNRIEVLQIKEAIADMNFRGENYDEALDLYSHIMSYSCSKHSKFFENIRSKKTTTENIFKSRPKV